MTDDTTTDDAHRPLLVGVLAVGFAALTAAILSAHAAPATAYELSIYHATPTAFWAGVGIALFAAVYVAFDATARRLRSGALLLGGTATFAIAALPVLRGYHFYGRGDSLTHWGWVRYLSGGELEFFDLLYPGVHTIATFTADVTGVTFPHAIMLVVLVFALVFMLFIPLATATLDSRAALVIGAFAAFLFLPINDVSVFFMAHPSTQAIMFFPVVLYLILRFVTGNTDAPLLRSRFGALLAATLVAYVLVHPQQAANVLLLVGTISVIQFGYRRFRRDHPIGHHRPLYAHTAILAGAFLLWTPRHPMAGGAVSSLLSRLRTFQFQPGAEAAQRGTALGAIGGSIEELFVKLFLVSAIVAVLAGGLMLANFLGWLDSDKPHANAAVTYLTFGLVPVFGLFALFFLTGYETLHFRLVGFMMVIVTVLGSVAIARLIGLLGARVSTNAAWSVAAVAFALLLAASVPVMFASPYIFQNGSHVTERQVEGYQTAFDHRATDVPFTGIRSPGIRFGDAVLPYEQRSHFARPGSSERPAYAGAPLYGALAEDQRFTAQAVQRIFDRPHYLPVSVADREREVTAYGGIRFSEQGFDSLDSTPGVHRVQTNGGFDLYLVE